MWWRRNKFRRRCLEEDVAPALHFLTWSCHVCGDVRPDARISVFKRSYKMPGYDVPLCEENIRYCNDRPACIEGAKTKTFFSSPPGEIFNGETDATSKPKE